MIQTQLTRESIAELLMNELRDMDAQIPDDIQPEMSFRNDFGLDSLGVAEFVARMEQAFRVEISDDDWHTLTTFGRAVDYVEGRLQS